MPVNSRDPDWLFHQPARKKVADLFTGRDTAVQYVRGLPGWDGPTLALIRNTAYFLPMVARTVETFGGLVFMKAPSRTMPEGLKTYLEDVTQTGQEMDRFAEQGLDAVMLTGSLCVVVDYPASDARVTRAQAEQMGLRPVLQMYDGRSILSARTMRVGAAQKLSHVRLTEMVEVPAEGDPFTMEYVEQVRVLEIVDGRYQQTVWREGKDGWEVIETIIPRMNGQPLTEIPAFFSNTRDGEPLPVRPPLTDLADINIAHLNNSAQMEWALAWLGAPVLFGAGIELEPGETIQMGSSQAIMAPDPSAKLEIIQADASKFSGLKVALDDKRRDAAALGARMLMETPRAQIAAETARIERAGETSVVGAMANAVSECLTKALRFMAAWAGVNGEIIYWLNTDLLPTGMDPQRLDALMRAWMQGGISKRELFNQLQAGEIVDPAKTYEEHEDEIAEEAPATGLMGEPEPDQEAA